jgi:hypothetical protein
MFNATYFTYDGIHSGAYDLRIANFDADNVETTSVFAPELRVAKPTNLNKFFHSGIEYDKPLECGFSFIREQPIVTAERETILSWLVGRKEFKKLQIHQPDLENYYYNCVFTNVDIIYVNGHCRGFKVVAKFDSPYCCGSPSVTAMAGDGDEEVEITLENMSSSLDNYTYPSVEFIADKQDYTQGLLFTKIDGGYMVGVGTAFNETEIVIPKEYARKPVIKIDNDFGACKNLVKLTIPFVGMELDGTTNVEIGYMFGKTGGFSSVLPTTLSEIVVTGGSIIGGNAFSGGAMLTSITLPDSLVSIGRGAFAVCRSLLQISIPSRVSFLDYLDFYACYLLTSINVAEDNEYFTSLNGVLYNKNITELIVCPAGLAGEITVPSTVTRLLQNSFDNCKNLTSIVLPDGLLFIDGFAFENCLGVQSIIIPKTVQTVHGYIFRGWESTQTVFIEGRSNAGSLPSGQYGWVFNWDGSTNATILYGAYTRGLLFTLVSGGYKVSVGDVTTETELLLPAEYLDQPILEVGNDFGVCTNVEKITIPFVGQSLNDVSNPQLGYIFGGDNFSLPTSLKQVVVKGGVTIGEQAFYNCAGLRKITLPRGLQNIGRGAFGYCSQLSSISIPNTVTTIGDYAFLICESLTSIAVPYGVSVIGNNTFAGCSGLKSIVLPFVGADSSGTNNPYFGYVFGANIIYGGSSFVPNKLTEVVITGGNKIADYAFLDCSGLVSISLPDTIVSIGIYGFAGCKALASIVIPEGVTTVGAYAFRGCYRLTEIRFPNSVLSIGMGAFDSCKTLLKASMFHGVVNTLGENMVFKDCRELTSFVVLGDDETYVSTEGVIYTKDKKTIVLCPVGKRGEFLLPSSVRTIERFAFSDCGELTSIILGDNVRILRTHCFMNCVSINSLIIPQKVTSVSNAFQGWGSHQKIYVESGSSSLFAQNDAWTEECRARIYFGIPGNSEDYYSSGLSFVTDGAEGWKVGVGTCIGSSYIFIPRTYKRSPVTEIINNFGQCTSLFCLTIPFVGTSIYGFNPPFESIFNPDSDAVRASLNTVIVTGEGNGNIGAAAFQGWSNIVQIILGDGVLSIDNYTFADCTGIQRFHIPQTVEWVGAHVFDNWTDSQKIYTTWGEGFLPTTYDGDWDNGSDAEIIYGNYVGGLIYAKIEGGYRVSAGYDEAMGGNKDQEEITIIETYGGEPIIEIDNNFGEYTHLKKLTIPFVGKRIDAPDEGDDSSSGYERFPYMFGNSIPQPLKEVVVTAQTRIAYEAFYNCHGIELIVLPDTTTKIAAGAFGFCSSLKKIVLPKYLTKIPRFCFVSCLDLATIILPEALEEIETYAFGNTLSIASMTIPATVTTVGEGAFSYWCEEQEIHIPWCESREFLPNGWNSAWDSADGADTRATIIWGLQEDSDVEESDEFTLRIINKTDDIDRVFELYNLGLNETVSVDNELRIITSDKRKDCLSHFNKNWLRFVKGANTLKITVKGVVVITCPTYKLIGF